MARNCRWYKYQGTDPDQRPGKWERDHETHAWIAFGVITGIGLISAPLPSLLILPA